MTKRLRLSFIVAIILAASVLFAAVLPSAYAAPLATGYTYYLTTASGNIANFNSYSNIWSAGGAMPGDTIGLVAVFHLSNLQCNGTPGVFPCRTTDLADGGPSVQVHGGGNTRYQGLLYDANGSATLPDATINVCFTNSANTANCPAGYVVYTTTSNLAETGVAIDLGATSYWLYDYSVDIYQLSSTAYTATPTLTATATSTGTVTATATPTIGPLQGGATGLQNGNFDLPSMDPWQVLTGKRRSAGPGAQPPTGPLFCGQSYFEVDPNFYASTDTYVINGQVTHEWRELPALIQRFYWPGGTAYFHSEVRASSAQGIQVGVRLTQVTTGFDIPVGMEIFARDGQGLASTQDWQALDQATSGPLPAGFYDLVFSTGYGFHDSPIYTSEVADLNADQSYIYYLDDVTISGGSYTSGCVNGATLTPSPTRTNTATATRTPTGTFAAPTNTSGPAGAWSNCAFESGSNGWVGNQFNIQLAGGPIGPSYAQVNSGGLLRQYFSWVGGTGYFTFWVGPGSYGKVQIRNLYTGTVNSIYVAANPLSWQLQKATVAYLPGGSYALEVVPNIGSSFKIDGVMVGANNFQYCGSSISGTAVTPTPGPTSFITATVTNTRPATVTSAPTLTPTQTRVPTSTPVPGIYQQLTQAAAQNATNSAILTSQANQQNTAIANVTSTANATSYAQATEIGSINQTLEAITTQQATQQQGGGGQPQPTTMPNPPDQPPMGSDTPCERPDNPLALANWIDYGVCRVAWFFTWHQEDSALLQQTIDDITTHEPFASFKSIGDALGELKGLLLETNWDENVLCPNMDFSPMNFLQRTSDLLNGHLDISPGQVYPNIDTDCTMAVEAIVGPYIKRGMCVGLHLMCYTGITAIIQYTLNIIVVLTFIMYMKEKVTSIANGGIG